MSELQRGKYADDFDDVHPDILNRYLGVDRTPIRNPNLDLTDSDSGFENVIDSGDLDEQITADQQPHIRHEPIGVPKHSAPFVSEEAEDMFHATFRDVKSLGVVPSGYGVNEAEWDISGYPVLEEIKSGKRGKQTQIELPFTVWWPKAVEWVQGLDTMTRICMLENGEVL